MSAPPLDQQDTESVSSVDSFDPASTLVQKTITREEALEQTGENISKMRKSKFVDKLLKPAVSKWLTEPILRVLPPEMKHTVHAWCLSHDPMWFNKLSEFIDDDISEWEYTVEVPSRRKDMAFCRMGADILQFYVADLKPLRKGLPEPERREVVNKVRWGVALFADFHDEKMKAMEREAHELVQQERDSMEIERSAFATAFDLQNEAIADWRAGMALSLQSLQHTLHQGPQMFPRIERRWYRSLANTGSVPESLRQLVEYRCSSDEAFRLAQLEEAFTAGETTGS